MCYKVAVGFANLGMPLSPQSQAKHRREHYLVKDKVHGFHCLNCGDKGDIDIIKASPCKCTCDAPTHAKDTATKDAKLAELLALEEEGNMLLKLIQEEEQRNRAEDILRNEQMAELARLEEEEAMLWQAHLNSVETAAAEAKRRYQETKRRKVRDLQDEAKPPASTMASNTKFVSAAASVDETEQDGLGRATDKAVDRTQQDGLARATDEAVNRTQQDGLARATDEAVNRTQQDGLARATDEAVDRTQQESVAKAQLAQDEPAFLSLTTSENLVSYDESESIAKRLLFDPSQNSPNRAPADVIFIVCVIKPCTFLQPILAHTMVIPGPDNLETQVLDMRLDDTQGAAQSMGLGKQDFRAMVTASSFSDDPSNHGITSSKPLVAPHLQKMGTEETQRDDQSVGSPHSCDTKHYESESGHDVSCKDFWLHIVLMLPRACLSRPV